MTPAQRKAKQQERLVGILLQQLQTLKLIMLNAKELDLVVKLYFRPGMDEWPILGEVYKMKGRNHAERIYQLGVQDE